MGDCRLGKLREPEGTLLFGASQLVEHPPEHAVYVPLSANLIADGS